MNQVIHVCKLNDMIVLSFIAGLKKLDSPSLDGPQIPVSIINNYTVSYIFKYDCII